MNIKRIKIIRCLLSLFLVLFAFNVFAFDEGSYKKIANNTIKQMNTGVVGDIDATIALQEQLIDIGMKGSDKFLQEESENAQALAIVMDNVEDMKGLSLQEIEELWHRGEYLKSKGVDFENIDHFSRSNSLMDAIIHPVTSYLLIKKYKTTGDATLLVRIKDELFEALEHIKHVKQAGSMSM